MRLPTSQDPVWMKPLILLISAALILLLLVQGRMILMPLAIAVLTWNLLDTVIQWLGQRQWRGLRVPRWFATLIGLGLVVLCVVVVMQVVASQVDAIASAWPRYVQRLENILAGALAYVGDDVAQQFVQALQSLDLTAALSQVLGSAGSFLISLGLVVIYVIFLMVERAHLPNKMAALFPNDARRREVLRVLLLISASLRRYLWIKTLMSLLTGLASYCVLRIFGVDFAETWALIIFLLNYIPNIGSILGVIFPSLLALVQFDTLWPVFLLSAVLGGLQMVIGNVLEPMMMGRTLNLSSFVIILSLTFWGAVWGIVGMFLSVPITVMVLIVCAHVPSWRSFAIMLSEDGALDMERHVRRRKRLAQS